MPFKLHTRSAALEQFQEKWHRFSARNCVTTNKPEPFRYSGKNGKALALLAGTVGLVFCLIFGPANAAAPRTPSPYLKGAQDMALKHDWAGLAQVTERWTKAEPGSAPAWTYYAVSQCRLGKRDTAEQAIKHEVTLAPNDPRPFEALAACYNARKEFAATVHAAEQAARIAPANPVVAFNLGVAWKNRAEATTGSSGAAAAAPASRTLQAYWLGAAEAFAHAGELKIAKAGEAWMLAGGSAYRALFFPYAVHAYLEAMKIEPGDKNVRHGLAQSASALKQACTRAKSFTIGDKNILQRNWHCDSATEDLLAQAKHQLAMPAKP